MSRAKCLHNPRALVANGGKHKDGTPILQCRECVRTSHNKYSRKKQGYDAWYQMQGGLCAFCMLPLDGHSNRTHLDHNHVTGVKRGLVHAACNLMIGGVENAVALMGVHRVLDYLGLTVDNT